jgi:sulfite exporter TauE/SafE/copper chaperone CopZ
MITKTIYVDNMTCVNCENTIERALSEKPGIDSVMASYSKGTVIVTYDESKISLAAISEILEQKDYHVRPETSESYGKRSMQGQEAAVQGIGYSGESKNRQKEHTSKPDYTNLAGVAIIIFAVYVIANRFGLFNIIYQFPVAKDGMGFGMLFLIGMLTSVHCVAMCGGICLSQCVPKTENTFLNKFAALRPSLLYNFGRVISYTVIGGIVGAIGSVVSFSGTMKGIVQILAGVFMVIMGLNMLNIFPGLRKFNPRMPKIFAKKIYAQSKSNSPLYIGLLNGLMPCGPLQAMQLYALSTGSPVKGALSMFLFSIGTVPLMFLFGAISSFLSKKFTGKMMKASAVLVVFLGIFMFNNGISLSGITLPMIPALADTKSKASVAVVQEDIQTVTSGITSGSYDPIVVQKGIPVKWTIQAEQGDINGCNNSIVIRKYNIQKQLSVGDNVIEFTPTESGTVSFSCWMGMIRSKITVVDDLNTVDSGTIADAGNVPASAGGCCGAGAVAYSDESNASGSNSSGSSSAGGNSDGSTAGDTSGGDDAEAYSEGGNCCGSVPGGLSDYNNILLPEIPSGEVITAQIQPDGTQTVEIGYGGNGFSPAVIVVQKDIETKWNIKASGVDSSKSTLIFPYYYAELNVEEGDNEISFIPDGDFYFYSSDGSFAGYIKVVDDIGQADIDAIRQEISEFNSSGSQGI